MPCMNARRHGLVSAPTNLRLRRAVRLAADPADAIGYRLNRPFWSVIWVTHRCECRGLGGKNVQSEGRQLDEPLPIAHRRSQEGNFRKRGSVLLSGEHHEAQRCSPSEFVSLVNSQAECCRLRYVGRGESIVGTSPALQASEAP